MRHFNHFWAVYIIYNIIYTEILAVLLDVYHLYSTTDSKILTLLVLVVLHSMLINS